MTITETYSTPSIRTPGARPITVIFNEFADGTMEALVIDALEGFTITSYGTVKLSRAEFDAIPDAFSEAALALFEKKDRLDHGVLSIPNRTSTINADLDKYKAAQAKIEARAREDRKFLAWERAAARAPAKEQALALYKEHGKILRAALKGKLWGTGQTPAEWLKLEAKVDPVWFVRWAESVINAK